MKMKSWIIGVMALSAGFAALGSYAAEQPYIGVDAAALTLSTTNAEVKPAALRLRGGSELSSSWGVEAHAMTGLVKDSAQLVGGSMDVNLQGLVALYLRPKLSLGDGFALYGLAGFAWSSIKAEPSIDGLVERNRRFADVSAGGGFEAKVFGNNYLSVDYVEYTEGLTAVSAGIRIPF